MQANRHMPDMAKDARDPLDFSAALTDDLSVTMHRTAMQCEMLEKPDKLLEILAANLRGSMPRQRLDLTSYPTTRISEALIEQGFTPDQRLIDAWAGKTPKGKGRAGRDKAITVELASRLEFNAGYTPKIRDWWTPTEAFFNRLTKTQLIEVYCDIGGGGLRIAGKPATDSKKGCMVDLLAEIFAGKLKGVDTAAQILAAAKTWLPPALRPAEAEMEETA